ncbi:hypothetical protein [Methanolobus sp. WCC5]|uniref:hypothetical protein n=1 Tax=Methanolobus sp. WCC5 TaxID=3125785 RepID=UPI0032547044
MTSVEAVEIALEECDRFRVRAEQALERLRAGEDYNSHTAAMRRASMDLTKALVDVRGTRVSFTRKEETKPPIRRRETTACDDAVVEGGTQPDPDQFLCSECGCLIDLHKQISPELTDGEKVCESCFHSNAYQAIRERKSEQKQPVNEQISNEWVDVPGVKNLQYRILDDALEIRKDGADCDKWSFDIFYTLLDLAGRTRSVEISSLVKGQVYAPKKQIALNQITTAIEKGIIELPGSDA